MSENKTYLDELLELEEIAQGSFSASSGYVDNAKKDISEENSNEFVEAAEDES